MGSERRGVAGPDPTRFAGPDVLGRSVLVSVGQDPPEPWTCSPRVTVSSDAPDSATAHRLRAAWSRRERLVVELSGRLPPAAQALHRPWWELHPGVTLGGDAWRYLLTANTVDARDGDRFGFAPADRARALGARAAGGEPGDVVTAAGGVWCDGGPLDVFDPAALDEVGVVPAVNLDVGDLAALRLCDPDAATGLAANIAGCSFSPPVGGRRPRAQTSPPGGQQGRMIPEPAERHPTTTRPDVATISDAGPWSCLLR